MDQLCWSSLRRTTMIVTRSWVFSTTGQSCTNRAMLDSCTSRLFFSFCFSFLFLVRQRDIIAAMICIIVYHSFCCHYTVNLSICSLLRVWWVWLPGSPIDTDTVSQQISIWRIPFFTYNGIHVHLTFIPNTQWNKLQQSPETKTIDSIQTKAQSGSDQQRWLRAARGGDRQPCQPRCRWSWSIIIYCLRLRFIVW
jgi:hypothetical protein